MEVGHFFLYGIGVLNRQPQILVNTVCIGTNKQSLFRRFIYGIRNFEQRNQNCPWQAGILLLTPDEAETSVLSALQCGYRLIDTANAYVNEKPLAGL